MSDDSAKVRALPALTPPPGSFAEATGLVLDDVSGTTVRGHVEVTAKHHTPWGVVHGGLYASVVETMASLGASAVVLPQGQYAVGVNNSTDFIRSMRTGTLDAVAEAVHVGRTQQLWQVVLTDRSNGKLVARGQVRLHNLDIPDAE